MNDFTFLKNKNQNLQPGDQQDPAGVVVGPMALEDARMNLARWNTPVDQLVEKMEAFEVATEDDMATVTEMLGQAKKLKKDLQLAAEVVYKPAFDFQKAVKGILKTYVDRIDKIIKMGNRKNSDYGYQQEMARRKAEAAQKKKLAAQQKKIDALAKKENIAPVQLPTTPVAEKPAAVKTESGSARVKMVWVAEVVDIESKPLWDYIKATMPDEYKALASKAMAKAIKAGFRKMKGVDFREVAKATHRAR